MNRRLLATLMSLVGLVGLVPILLASGGLSHLLPAGAGTSGGLTAADGYVPPSGLRVQDGGPAIANLDPGLRAAVRAAARDAAADGVRFRVTSGWRSHAYQQHLMDEAVEKYGSAGEARRWVKPADESSHVTGHAVDVGPTGAAYWLSRYGSRYGLCQVYANEIWHYERLTRPGGRCPGLHPDSAS